MTYDPFARGPSTVEVRSGTVVDERRAGRALSYDVRRPRPGEGPMPGAKHPLVVFSHTSFGHRRQSTFLLDHLASHGYVAAAADHTGNAAADLAARAVGADARTQEERDAYIAQIIGDRAPDIRLLTDSVVGGAAHEAADRIDSDRLGLIGWSFGGWAVLATLEADDRFGSVVAITPAGSSSPLPGIIPATLTFAWQRAIPTLYLAAERDQFTPVAGIVELVARTPSDARLFVLAKAGHDHFGDDAAPAPPTPAQAQAFTRGLVLAHLDASLRGMSEAAAFLETNAEASLAEVGVDATRVA